LKQGVVLRRAGLADEIGKGTLFVATGNVGRGEHLFETIGAATGTRKRAFHRIEFGAGSKAVFANFGVLRLAEFCLIYHLSHLTKKVNVIIPYNALAVTNTRVLP
jgi:hypothetical protein